MLGAILDKVEAGKRLDRAEGRWLLTEAPLLDLGSLAQDARFRRIPERRVTFVIDSNPNYTNVCVTDCQFCAFYRKPGHPEAWTLTVEEVLAKVESAAEKGASSTMPTRPANDSDAVFINGGLADPSSRYRPAPRPRSSAWRRAGKRAGRRCASSMSTRRGLASRKPSMSFASTPKSDERSRSSRFHPRQCRAASVLLPHWRGPRSNAQGNALSWPLRTLVACRGTKRIRQYCGIGAKNQSYRWGLLSLNESMRDI